MKLNYEEGLIEEIKRSEKEFLKKAEKIAEGLTPDGILKLQSEQMHHFIDNFWLYNKLMAESELRGFNQARKKFLRLIKDVKESKEMEHRYDKKTIQNLCAYFEIEVKR